MSLLGFTSLVFFSVTGITLNHPEWFGTDAQRVVEHQGDLHQNWLRSAASSTGAAAPPPAAANISAANTPAANTNSEEPSGESLHVSKFEIVEHLRQAHRIRGAVSEFRVDEAECLILFKGPGYSADTVINRETGHYTITETVMGAVAIINDLHKGRDSGPVWFWVIDITALLMIFVSVTGIILIFFLKRKRWSGIITAVVGTILFAALYFCCP